MTIRSDIAQELALATLYDDAQRQSEFTSVSAVVNALSLEVPKLSVSWALIACKALLGRGLAMQATDNASRSDEDKEFRITSRGIREFERLLEDAGYRDAAEFVVRTARRAQR